mgnify:CR=1 FL=1
MKKFNNSFDVIGKKNYEVALKKAIKSAIKDSGFYKRKLKNFKNTKFNIKEFEKIPFTTKKDLLDDQKKYSPFGSNLSVDISQIQRVHRTSGTTDRPLILALTKNDIKLMTETGSICSKISGLQKEDIVVHCLNYCMWMGGLTDHMSLEKAGAAVIPYGVGNSKQLIETILNIKASTISCTPSYLNKLIYVLKEFFDIEPKQLGLRLGLLGTEGGLQDPNYRKKIEDIWGIKAINFNYGMAEVWSVFGSECYNCQNGLNFVSNGNLYLELIDPKTSKGIEIKPGSEGEMVVTTLCKEAQPIIRYRTGDIIRINQTKPCKCGNKGIKFDVIGRSDDMLTIKGINVFPSQIRTIINKHLDKLSGQFQIILDRPLPIENLQMKIEKAQDTTSLELEILKNKLVSEFKNNLHILPHIDFVSQGSLTADGTKSKIIKKTY